MKDKINVVSHRFLFGCLVLTLLIPHHLKAQSKYDSLTANLQKVVVQDSLPGLSVILVDAHQIIYKKNFGYADIKGKVPYSFKTIQNIGSVSKTILSVALMKAIELHYFNLETEINDILPFKVTNPHTNKGGITIKQLTDHTSGIIDNPSIYPNTCHFYPDLRGYSQDALSKLQAIGYKQAIPDSDLKDFLFNYLSSGGKYYGNKNFVNAEPGQASVYSNIASALIAYLIEIKSGMSYAEFTNKYIIKPLKMVHSGWFLSSVNLKNHAYLYYDLKEYFPLYDEITYPDGSFKTSPEDLSKYLQAIIRGYSGDTTLLSKASYKEMFTPHFELSKLPAGFNATKRNKGVLWNLYTNGMIGHDGDDPGVSTFLFFNKTTGKGGLFICNKYMEDKSAIVNLLYQTTNK